MQLTSTLPCLRTSKGSRKTSKTCEESGLWRCRRLRTGRQLIGEDESPVPKGKLPWLPLDERFNSVKNFGAWILQGSSIEDHLRTAAANENIGSILSVWSSEYDPKKEEAARSPGTAFQRALSRSWLNNKSKST